VNAFACDLTRIVSFQFGQEGGASMRFPFLGFPDETLHYWSHEDRPDDYIVDGPMWTFHTFFAEQFAYLLNKLKTTLDSDGGTLYDNTLVLWLTTMGEGRKHDSEHIPVVVAGGAGGAIAQGRSYVLKDRYINDLHLSVAHLMGVDIDSFGAPELSTRPITEFWA
jgi:hypothetical protein